MTPDEALAALSSAIPLDGKWGPFRQRQTAAREFFADFSGEPLRALLPQILRLLGSTNDTTIQGALAVPVARATLEFNERSTNFLERVASTPYVNPYTDALIHLAKNKTDIWPVLHEMLGHQDVSADNQQRVLSEYLELNPTAKERFDEALKKAPRVALRSASGARLFVSKLIPAFVPSVVDFVLATKDEELRIDALRLLESVKSLEDDTVALFELLLEGASPALSSALASFFVKHAVKKKKVPVRFLSEPRPDVRLAAFNAFISRPEIPRSDLQVVIHAWADPEARIRETAERVLREFTEANGLTPEELEPINSLRKSKDRDDVAIFLAWAAVQHAPLRDWCLQHVEPQSKLFATLSAKHSLVCVACRTLGMGTSWGHEMHTPKARRALEFIVTLEETNWDSTSLYRCKTCFAHFTIYARSEIDVNSRHDDWNLRRLKLTELRNEFAKHVDLSDQRLVNWKEAAESDLRHVDPKVRELAKWELS